MFNLSIFPTSDFWHFRILFVAILFLILIIGKKIKFNLSIFTVLKSLGDRMVQLTVFLKNSNWPFVFKFWIDR